MNASLKQDTNSQEVIRQNIAAGQITWLPIVGMLFSRIVGFALFQALIAGLYALSGATNAWEASIPWWPLCAALTNVVCIILLAKLFQREGARFWTIFRFQRATFWQDLLAFLGIALLSIPVAMLPNTGLAQLLFGSAEGATELFFRPLPVWGAAAATILFPLTIAFAELPTYFGYVMPRLEGLTGKAWLGWLLPVLLLSAQHATLPLVFNGRFIVWRLVMFLPFAMLVGLVLRWRPRLMPYLVIFHGLLDLATAWLVLSISL